MPGKLLTPNYKYKVPDTLQYHGSITEKVVGLFVRGQGLYLTV
jgi:hypothetical protein